MIFGRKKNDYSNRNTEQKIKKPEESKEERVAGSSVNFTGIVRDIPNPHPFSLGSFQMPGYVSNGQLQRTIISHRDPIGRDRCEIGQFWLNKTERKLWIMADVEHGEGVWIWI